jgi:hypothetical protein
MSSLGLQWTVSSRSYPTLFHTRTAKLGYPVRRSEGNRVTKHHCFQMLSTFRSGDIQDQGPPPHCTEPEKIEVSKVLAPNNRTTELGIQGHLLHYRIPLSMSFIDRGDTKKLNIICISVKDSGFPLNVFQWPWQRSKCDCSTGASFIPPN